MPLSLSQSAPDFSLRATDGRTVALADVRGAKLTLVVFACNHCPYVQAYEPRLFALIREYAPKGLGAVFINSNNDVTHPQDSFDAMVRRQAEVGHPCPYLRDESQDVAKAYGARYTPEVFLFDESLALRYNGGVDDNAYEPEKITRHSLRDAIEALLAGRKVPVESTKAIGCTVKWK